MGVEGTGNLLINGLTPERSCYAPVNAPYSPENQRHTPGMSRHPPETPRSGGGCADLERASAGVSPNKWLNARKKLLCAQKCAVSAWKPASYARNESPSARKPWPGREGVDLERESARVSPNKWLNARK